MYDDVSNDIRRRTVTTARASYYCTCTAPIDAPKPPRCTQCGAPLCQACADHRDHDGRGPECGATPKPAADA